MKKYILIALLIVSLFSCVKKKTKKQINFKYSKQVENLVDFFNENAYDSVQKTYYSDIGNQGKVISEKIYNVALSRVVYGLSYTSKFYPQHIEKAKNAVQFQLNNLIDMDSVGMYFVSSIDGGIKPKSTRIDIWQQAYGLCGLTEYYRNSPNNELLNKIHQLNDAFVMRFRDTINGGFYGAYSFKNGQVLGSKSLQSLMYPITAYMGNLWLVDINNRKKYEPILKENLDILYNHSWNENRGWVHVKFDDDWKEQNTIQNVTGGHNFQLASLFLRTKKWTFLSEKDKKKYVKIGEEILSKTLSNPNFLHIEKGFYREFNPVTNAVIDNRKSWWQHAEALIALSLSEGAYETKRSELEKFYFENFQDYEFGGEYFYLTKDNAPIKTELKGSVGKSLYHTIEMIRYQIKNK